MGKIFSGRCSGIGTYSLGTLFFFTSADLMKTLKVWTSACILHNTYCHVSGDRLD